MDDTKAPRIWMEVEDLIRFFDGASTPTGIQRVQLEILPHLAGHKSGRVGFCRKSQISGRFEVVDWATVEQLTAGVLDAGGQPHVPSADPFGSRALRQVKRFLTSAVHDVIHARKAAREFAETVRPGDYIVNLGASWANRNFAQAISGIKARQDVRFAILIHDILPVSHPGLVDTSHVDNFRSWLDGVTKLADIVFTPSKATKSALTGYMAGQGLAPPPVRPIPFGAGFAVKGEGSAPSVLPQGSYALFVSTIEIRKNHALLVEVWRRLLEKFPADQVPTLVFAGKWGWHVEDLKKELAANDYLDGKIVVVNGLSDPQLASAYRNCHITLFPSFCEGWGLPISEGLSFGKLGVASDATSVPEAGGRFLDYFAPDDTEAACQAIERALFDHAYREKRESEIVASYQLPKWSDTANAIVDTLGRR